MRIGSSFSISPKHLFNSSWWIENNILAEGLTFSINYEIFTYFLMKWSRLVFLLKRRASSRLISNKLLIEHENKIDNKIHELDIIDKQKSKREKNKKSMVNTENNLKNKVSPLSDRSEEINSSLLGLKSSKVLSKSEPKKVKKIINQVYGMNWQSQSSNSSSITKSKER